jgi:hypothetical protein
LRRPGEGGDPYRGIIELADDHPTIQRLMDPGVRRDDVGVDSYARSAIAAVFAAPDISIVVDGGTT